MKRIFLPVFLMIGFIGFGQNNTAEEQDKKGPKTSWSVNTQYDENGNLISRDSTFSYSWSSFDSSNEVDLEEIKKSMSEFLNDRGLSSFSHSQFFFNDSIQSSVFSHDFFTDFSNSREDMLRKIKELQEQMRELMEKENPKQEE